MFYFHDINWLSNLSVLQISLEMAVTVLLFLNCEILTIPGFLHFVGNTLQYPAFDCPKD